jgi:hypothetical protein
MMFVTPNSTKSGNKRQQQLKEILHLVCITEIEPSLISEHNPRRQLRPNLMMSKLILNPGEPFGEKRRKYNWEG